MQLGLRTALGVCLFAVLAAWPAPARAEEDAATRAAARKLAEDGVAALQAGDAKTATHKLDKAYSMLKVPSVALWSARALLKQAALVEAAERFLEATRLPSSGDVAVQDRAKADAEKELEQLRPRIPHLIVAVAGASETDVTVTLDGQALPGALLGEDRPVNPGPHRLVGKRGGEEQVQEVTVAEGERKQVTLNFVGSTDTAQQPAPSVPAAADTPDRPARAGNTKRTIAFVALAAGGVGLAVGAGAGVVALNKKSALDDDERNCADGMCLYAVESEVSSLRTFRTVSTIGFIAGGALAATGVVLLLTSSSSEQQGQRVPASLALRVGPASVQLGGRF